MTRARDLADSQDNLGGAIAPVVAGKNYLINGNFDFFQRTSFASQTQGGYAFDRWYGGVGGNVTLTQQTTGVPQGSQFCGRMAYNASNSYCNLYQALESALVTTLIGRTITVSVKVRRNASFAANLILGLDWGNTANTLTGGSWTEFATSTMVNSAIPTGTTSSDWTTISVTTTVPTNALGLRIHIYENVVGSSGAYWEVAQAQLELGIVATPFSRAGGSIGGELSLCQRYYYQYNSSNTMIGNGIGSSTTIAGRIIITPPVPFRTSPTAITSGTQYLFDGVNTPTVSSYGAAYWANNSYNIDANSTGLTQYRPYQLWNYTGLFALSAEL